MVNESAASSLIHLWAGSSNDSSPPALAMQDAAQKEFGLKGTAPWAGIYPNMVNPDDLNHRVNNEVSKNGALYQSFLRAQYTNTQSALAAQGITELSVYRGAAVTTETEKALFSGETSSHPAGGAQPIETTLRPLSSWST